MEDLDRTRKFDILESSYRLPSRSFHREERHQHRTENGGKHEKLPRIVLKDVTGRRLDTFTHLQEAIYRARQNIRQTRAALTADEWRLPHAPAPARPDYSRAAPPMVKLRDKLRGDLVHLSKNTKTTSTKIYEVDVDDVAFVAQSINNLPSMPSLSFLRQEILREPKNYFQIVQTILLHKRFTKQTDKREAIYNFPGFCSGCRRAGLCYGCEQSLIPHYHTDRLMKTGGGFTYYKKYRPEKEVAGRHPLNWRVQFPDLAFKSVMKGHESGELDLLEEEIEHDENCLLKGLLDNPLSLPVINRDGMLTSDNLVSSRQSEEKEDEGIVADRRSLEDRLSKRDQRSARMSNTSGQGSETSGQIGEGYHGDGYLGDGYQGDGFQAGGYQANDYDNFQRGDNSQLTHPRIVDLIQQEQDEDELSYDENFIRESMDKASVGTRENEEQDGNEDTEGIDMDNGDKHDENQEMSTDEENEDTHASRSRTRTRSTRLSHEPLTASSKNRDRDNDGSYTTKSSSPFSRKFDRLYQGKAYSPEGSGSVDSRRRLYRAPPAFKIRKNERRKIKASSPFSNERDYNLDLGKKFELKKSEKKLTQFKEFQHKGGDWKAPQQFELKKNEREEVKFWRPKHKDKEPKKRGRYRKTVRPASPDSGLESEKTTDPVKEEKIPEMEERVLTPASQRISTPPEKPKRVIQKKQFIKREIERKPPTPIPRICTPQTPIPQEKEPETAIRTPEIEEDTTPIKLPELVRIDTPPLPEFIEKKWEPVVKEDRRTAILPVPKLKEPLKSPTLRKKKVNMPRSTHKRSRSKQAAEAPVTKEEVQKMQDPLDFLAKYCIVSKDRLPFYERIYKNIIEGQPMRYERDPLLSPRTGMPIEKNDEDHDIGWEEHQLNMFHDLVTISRGHEVSRPGVNVPEQYLEKISYTLEILDKKQKQITDDLHMLQGKKLGHIAEKAKQMIPDISKVIYQPKAGKKSKKKKKKKNDKGSDDFEDDFPPTVPLKAEDITDEVIAMRLDEATYKKICKKGEIPLIELEMQRCAEKLAGIDDRLMELEGERNILTLYCMEVFFNEQNDNNRPIEFRRQQSALFRHLHPDPDVEMNIEELEGALQVVNHNLISESEFDYLYQILNLPGRRKINFQLFTIIAALSEKISQMDPVIKKMLIKDNPEETKKKRRSYDALDLKMETSKELFGLLADGDYETNNNGNAKASSLAVELTAGGLDPEHVGYVLSKFNRFGTGYIDFMDFVTYVPLFIEIHQKIVDDPFNVSLDV